MTEPPPLETQPDDFYVQALLLAEVTKRILKRRADIDLSEKPILKRKPIVEFRKRMRVTGLEKFPEKTYIATVNFYRNEEDFENHQSVGAIIIYVPESYIVKLFQEMGYPVFEEDEEDILQDACGTFCNLIAGNFKSGLAQLGFEDLVMSHFSTYQNDILNGLEYDPLQKELYELSFFIKDHRRIVADLTMGFIPRANPSAT